MHHSACYQSLMGTCAHTAAQFYTRLTHLPDFLPTDVEHLSPKGLDKSSTSGEEIWHYGLLAKAPL